MSRKALFFDIDGTIWDRENYICPSTIEAIQKLKERGCLTFICSGRSRAYINNPKLLGIGFDGIISGCGTMIEYNDEVVFYRKMGKEEAIKAVETIRKYGYRPILEGREYLYFDDEDFADDGYGSKVKREMGSKKLGVSDNYGEWDIVKLSCATGGYDIPKCREELKEYFDFIIHNDYVIEIVPKGFCKASGILKVCELLDIDIKDTYAFGDSNNDFSMLEIAGHSIVMENGTDEVKKIAEYITTSVTDDGIFNACRHYGLI